MLQQTIVVGAGAVGISTALELQQRGHDVTLVDRVGAAQETSHGNAGVISQSSIVPLNNPDLHSRLLTLLRNDSTSLRYHLPFMARRLGWAMAFLNASKSTAAARHTAALHSLISLALPAHKALMQDTGNAHRLSEPGWLRLYRKPATFRGSFEAEQYRRFDVPVTHLNPRQLQELEPALKPIFSEGLLFTGAGLVDDPGKLFAEHAERFVTGGGRFEQQEIMHISHRAGHFVCQLAQQTLQARHLIICAGPWSDTLLAGLGYRVPLGFERGYHREFHWPDSTRLTRSIYDADGGYVLGPMRGGARLTSGVELNHRDAPSHTAQMTLAEARAREAIDLGEPRSDTTWRGARPTLPDSLPLIGAAPGIANLWVGFGHQHIGMMTGPITGRLLAQCVCSNATDIDLAPFNPSRWLRRIRPTRPPVWQQWPLSNKA